MPFVSEMGGWVEKCPVVGGKEIRLCLGTTFPFDYNNPITYQVWYSGAFSTTERRFEENVAPLWRVQTHKFNKKMWEWFLDGREADEQGNKVGLRVRDRMSCNYIEDGLDVTCVHKWLGKEFAYPLWVLQELINDGTITNQNLIDAIEVRAKEEKTLGVDVASSSETKDEAKVDPKIELAKKKLEEMEKVIDPSGELKSQKRKVKA